MLRAARSSQENGLGWPAACRAAITYGCNDGASCAVRMAESGVTRLASTLDAAPLRAGSPAQLGCAASVGMAAKGTY
eukprot:scaffold17373_cov116-Isochrysis_galbana.AAC.2